MEHHPISLNEIFGVFAGFVEAVAAERVREEFLFGKIVIVGMGAFVVFAVTDVLYQFGGSNADVQENRQIAGFYSTIDCVPFYGRGSSIGSRDD